MTKRREQSAYAPHECTECGEAAYIPFTGMARCTNWQCNRFDQKIWEEHVLSLPDTGDPDDEPTQPRIGGLADWLPDDTDPLLLRWHAEEATKRVLKYLDTVPSPCYPVDDGPKQTGKLSLPANPGLGFRGVRAR